VYTTGIILLVTESRVINFVFNGYKFVLTLGLILTNPEHVKYWMMSAIFILFPYCVISAMSVNVMLGKAMDIQDRDLYRALKAVRLGFLIKFMMRVTDQREKIETLDVESIDENFDKASASSVDNSSPNSSAHSHGSSHSAVALNDGSSGADDGEDSADSGFDSDGSIWLHRGNESNAHDDDNNKTNHKATKVAAAEWVEVEGKSQKTKHMLADQRQQSAVRATKHGVRAFATDKGEGKEDKDKLEADDTNAPPITTVATTTVMTTDIRADEIPLHDELYENAEDPEELSQRANPLRGSSPFWKTKKKD